MNNYRIYHMDATGSIVGGLDAKCESDEAACAIAHSMIRSNERSEIWLGTRCVGQVCCQRPTLH